MLDWKQPLLAQANAGPDQPATTDPSPSAVPTDGSTTTPGQPGGGAAGTPTGSPLQNPLFFLIFLLVMMYVFVFLGRGKKQKKYDKMLSALKKNDRIVTIGGIVGTVVSTRGDEVVVKVDEGSNTKMTFVRKAIQRVLADEDKSA